ncbi:Glycoside hydrolase, 38 vacuolar alpha mannosidase [Tieghemiomyces parasiticus]|uniref:Alpha-mannosidase n=1 Tax=Tieghemiomyces parasiticus TaxID=78921 RepID=A0A9W7ZS09_9FUNG|nr:Glycoside hydrolase, 38 vacuolar alpha mannosidase [Tieghemiomyces parasiticus]
MQKHRDITRDRFGKFLSSGQFGDVSLAHVLTTKIENGPDYVKLAVYSVPNQQRIPFADAAKASFKPTKAGSSFGPTWSTHWFKISVKVPKDWVGEEIEFRWDAGCEGLLWSTDGVPIHGLISGTRVEYILTEKSVGGETFHFYVEMACNGLFGMGAGGMINPPDMNRYFRIDRAELAVNNVAARCLWRDFEIIKGIVDHLPERSPRAAQAFAVANDICNAYDRDDLTSIDRCRELAAKFFKAKNGAITADGSGSAQHRITAVGNCHIDTAWLWPFAETKRKVARSWSTQIRLMEQYPAYTFAASQAQQFKWLQENYPVVFKQIQQRTAQGQFIPIGGTWVEMDCNMPSGEALVRQFLFGQRYFQQHFGRRCEVFWLPDTFGYSAQLPQIIRGADMRYFFTQKLSWNNINKFPHTTFQWIGLDGRSQVLTHMAPSETYAAQVQVGELVDSVDRHRDLPYTNESMLLYGDGDGGGGPTPAMLQRMELIGNIEGLPRVEFGNPNDFYRRVERESGDKLVSWKGELYFELHRGTYTSQAATKKGNRSSEFLMREVEAIAALCHAQGIAGRTSGQKGNDGGKVYKYPQREINRLWERILLNQFHDVLPGSSIEMVYQDAAKLYQEVAIEGRQLVRQALQVLHGGKLVDEGVAVKNPDEHAVMVFNSLPWRRTEVIEVPIEAPLAGLQQTSTDGQTAFALLRDVDPLTSHQLDFTAAAELDETTVPVTVYQTASGDFVLENVFISATFNAEGRLIRLFDRRNEREVMCPGMMGNLFRVYEDIPIYWDAWDVEVYHLEKGSDAGVGRVTIHAEGPLVGSLEVIYDQLTPAQPGSSARQIISLTATSPRLDFTCDVDWHENRRMLKVEFQWDLMNDLATYETQFGVVQRPTHFNTSWDLAKFEVCGHKFADLSEVGYGVALLNDCKYGYSTYRNTMRISLLRAPKAPDAHCDMGHHRFRYAVYPHLGTFAESDVVQEAYRFNVPLLPSVFAARPPPSGHGDGEKGMTPALLLPTSSSPFHWVGSPNVVLDTLKKAEDSNDLIVRLYEAYGGQGRGHLRVETSFVKVKRAVRCNLLEDESGEVLRVEAGCGFPLVVKPFEIVTLKLSL